MAQVCLVLTNPYAYQRALEVALQHSDCDRLKVIFLIDPGGVDTLVRDLGQQGWLGLNPRRNLGECLLDGYRALATDVLEDVRDRCRQAEIPVETSVEETGTVAFLERLFAAGETIVLASASRSLVPKGSPLRHKVEWLAEK